MIAEYRIFAVASVGGINRRLEPSTQLDALFGYVCCLRSRSQSSLRALDSIEYRTRTFSQTRNFARSLH